MQVPWFISGATIEWWIFGKICNRVSPLKHHHPVVYLQTFQAPHRIQRSMKPPEQYNTMLKATV